MPKSLMGTWRPCDLCGRSCRGGIGGYSACDRCYSTAYRVGFAIRDLREALYPSPVPIGFRKQGRKSRIPGYMMEDLVVKILERERRRG